MKIQLEKTSNVLAFALAALLAAGFAGTSASAADADDWAGMKTAKIAEVASVTGRVEASDGSGRARTLRQGDLVYAGERVATAANSTAGLWLDESLGQPEGSLAQLESDSRARVTRASGGGARVSLEKGAVRIVDPREDGAGPAIELVALDSETRMIGGDREARILKEKTGPYAVMCDWEKPMTVARGPQSVNSPAGGCVVGNNREPLFASPGHEDRIPLLAGAPPVAAAGPPIDPAALLNDPTALPPVAAPGPGGPVPIPGNFPGPAGLPFALLNPCGAAGSACNRSLPPGPPLVVIQLPPGNTPAPGI